MENKVTPIVTAFQSPNLNKVGAELIQNYKGYHENSHLAREYAGKAIVRRFISGKLLSENHEEIMEEMGSQRAFGENLGISEGMLSNDKRAYEAAKDRGADTPEKLLDLLNKKNLKSNVWEWERLPKLLDAPDSYREPDRRGKDEKTLEELHSQIEDIKVRNEGANPEIAERAQDTLKYLEDVETHIGSQDVFKSKWRSRDYLDWVKSVGWDYITGEQAKHLDPHHTLIDGGSRGPDGKVADVFTIPVNRATHEKWENKVPNKDEKLKIAEALIRTMALFITTHKKSDK